MPIIQKFPMDGFADTCTGYGREMHGTNEELGTGNDALCNECSTRLTADCKPKPVVRVAQSCTSCFDHAHGSRYFDCICCYGD